MTSFSRETTRIYLVRHGQVEGSEEKRYNGQSDVRLTSLGLAQFGALQKRLEDKPIAAVYSSDLSRCLDGARIISKPHGLVPVALRALRELDIGHWQGKAWDELKRRYPEEWQARLKDIVHYRVPGGENLIDVRGRVAPALQELVERHRGEEVVVVGHGGINRIVLLEALAAPLSALFRLEQNFGCLNIVDYRQDGGATVQLVNG
ncbi:MAG: alpha-ribazole phosphatase [Syntrophotaleaceae bacterium]